MRLGIKTGKRVTTLARSFEEKVGGIIKAVNEIAEMQKARGKMLVTITDKNGHKTRRWKNPEEIKQMRQKKTAHEKGREKKVESSAEGETDQQKQFQYARKKERYKAKLDYDNGKISRKKAIERMTLAGMFVSEAESFLDEKIPTGSEQVQGGASLVEGLTNADGEKIAAALKDAFHEGKINAPPPETGDQYRQLVRLAAVAIKNGKNTISDKDADKYAHVTYEPDELKAVVSWVTEHLKGGQRKQVQGGFPRSEGKKIGIRTSKNESGQEGGKPKEGANSNLSVGETISGTDMGGNEVSGKITAIGKDGVTLEGNIHVLHGQIKQGEGDDGLKRTYIEPDKFNADEYARQWDDPNATADEAGKEHILKSFGADGETIANAIRDADSKNKRLENDGQLTHDLYRISGKGESARYDTEREKVHGRIMQELLSPDKIRSALPPLGQKPKFIILGGRGGSGKSWFKNNLYDPNKTIILDADEIREKLPEYKGWNANQVHEESSDITEQMLSFCIRNGLNVVLDATMKTAKSALTKVLRFQDANYKTEAHYMHCPKQIAAKRAITRFRDGGKKGPNGEPPEPFAGRYVPVTAVLKNTTNEDSFEQVRRIVDEWSFRDSNGKDNELPVLISEGKKEVKN